MAEGKNVVFDVIGTLFTYDALFDAVEDRLGPKLRAAGVPVKFFAHCWLETAEREYTNLSLASNYQTFFGVMKALFYRVLWFAGVETPHDFATVEDLDYIVESYRRLSIRAGAAECIEKLRGAGFTVWCFSTGDVKRVANYFEVAGVVKMPADNILSCDSTGVAKPILDAYRPVLAKLSSSGTVPWFAAAHMWDVSAAKKVGFKGAFSSVYEGEALPDIFGQLDVIAGSLPEMADAIIAAESR